MMKTVKFGNKNALEIIDTDFKKTIKELLWERAKVRPLDKNYRILNHESLPHLKKYPHLVAVSTYGKKFLLCLLKIDDKNHTIFIDRKGEMMIYMTLGFDESLFKGTIFDGEFMKDNDGNWIYFITDILLYDGKPTYLKQFKDKIELVQNIITTKYTAKEMDFCRFEMKEFFPYQYLDDLCNGYISRLNYKCSGLIFKNQFKNEKGLLYIFPENRTDTPQSTTTSVISSSIVKKITGSGDDTEPTEEVVDEPHKSCNNDTFTGANRFFLMKKTALPDVYELFGRNKTGEHIKVGMASITSMEVSKKMNKIFGGGGVGEVVVECKYIKRFKKWEPIECVSKPLSLLSD